MNTEQDFRKYLENKGYFNGEQYPLLMKLSSTITTPLPDKMKLTMAAVEMVLFASQFRRNIHLMGKTYVPVNAIAFILSKSGTSKDRTVNTYRKCFQDGYNYIEDYRHQSAKEAAIQKAYDAGDEDPIASNSWKKYLKPVKPLFSTVSTSEGLISHLNDLEEQSCGAAYIYNGELGDILVSNADMRNNLTLLSEMYDLGKKEVKIIKSQEFQSKPIKCMPISALFVGSENKILLDDVIRNEFRTEFVSKLSRRSFFNYNKIGIEPDHGETVDQLLARELAADQMSAKFLDEINTISLDTAKHNIMHKLGKPLQASDIYNSYNAYKHYNEIICETKIDEVLYEMAYLSRKHVQWRALKLAGAFAVFDNSDRVTEDHYRFAVNFCEVIDEDVMVFEDELRKEKYEHLIDVMRLINKTDGKGEITAHHLRKLKFITAKNPESQLKDLVKFANQADSSTLYETNDLKVTAVKLQSLTNLGVSYKTFDETTTKAERVKNAVDGYVFEEVQTFGELGILLTTDCAYMPFNLKDGYRSNDNLTGTTRWVILDVDDTSTSDIEMHEILYDINHHIARTTNANNPYKYRIMLELDSNVDIPTDQWAKFISKISDDLGIPCDKLPKAQFYIGWGNRDVLSVTDKFRLSSKKYLVEMKEKKQPIVKLTGKKLAEILANPMGVFWYAYESEHKKRALYKVVRHAKDLGCDYRETLDIVKDLTDYWVEQVDPVWFNGFQKQIAKLHNITLGV